MDKNNIGERIKQIRIDSGLTQEVFGKKIGLKKSGLSLIESGKNNPSEATKKSIINEFSVNEDWLNIGIGEVYDYAKITAKKGGELILTSVLLSQNLLDLLESIKNKTVEDAIEIETSIQTMISLLKDPGVKPDLFGDYYPAITSVFLDIQRYVTFLKSQNSYTPLNINKHLQTIIKSLESLTKLYLKDNVDFCLTEHHEDELWPLLDVERNMLLKYRLLDTRDQCDIKEIINMKYQRAVKRGRSPDYGSGGRGSEEEAATKEYA